MRSYNEYSSTRGYCNSTKPFIIPESVTLQRAVLNGDELQGLPPATGQVMGFDGTNVVWSNFKGVIPTLQEVLDAGNITDNFIDLSSTTHTNIIDSQSITITNDVFENKMTESGLTITNTPAVLQTIMGDGNFDIQNSGVPNHFIEAKLNTNDATNGFFFLKNTVDVPDNIDFTDLNTKINPGELVLGGMDDPPTGNLRVYDTKLTTNDLTFSSNELSVDTSLKLFYDQGGTGSTLVHDDILGENFLIEEKHGNLNLTSQGNLIIDASENPQLLNYQLPNPSDDKLPSVYQIRNYATAYTATNTATTSTTSANTYYPTFVGATSGDLSHNVNSGFTYQPSTGTLTASMFNGDLSGNVSNATNTTITPVSSGTYYPTFVSATSGNQGHDASSGFTYNASTGVLKTNKFNGDLSGNVSTLLIPNDTRYPIALLNGSSTFNQIGRPTGAINYYNSGIEIGGPATPNFTLAQNKLFHTDINASVLELDAQSTTSKIIRFSTANTTIPVTNIKTSTLTASDGSFQLQYNQNDASGGNTRMALDASGVVITSTNIGYTLPEFKLINGNTANGSTTGVPSFESYKSGRDASLNDVIYTQSFNANNAGIKRTFGKIECVATGVSGNNTRGALDFYAIQANNTNLVFRLNGADNENNTFRPFDMNGNNLKTSTGNLYLDASNSDISGQVIFNSKTQVSNTTIDTTFRTGTLTTLTHSDASGWNFQANTITTSGDINCLTVNPTSGLGPILTLQLITVSPYTIPSAQSSYNKLYRGNTGGGNSVVRLPPPGTYTNHTFVMTTANTGGTDIDVEYPSGTVLVQIKANTYPSSLTFVDTGSLWYWY